MRKTTVISLSNDHRRQGGCRSLRRSRLLTRSAQAKAARLARTGTLEHGRWWKLINKFARGAYGKIGENIAGGQNSAVQVVEQWWDSPQHRRNILDDEFTHIGVGFALRGEREWWVQHFGTSLGKRAAKRVRTRTTARRRRR